MDKTNNKQALKTVIFAISIALVAVFTLIVRVPLGTGYVNLCDVAIFFIAFTFSPITAFVSAGLGTALADLIGGYPQWAIVSFVVHGLQALLVALIIKAKKDSIITYILASIVGIIIVPLGYFLISGAALIGFNAALTEIPGNLIQVVVGGVLGFAVHKAVVKAYPPILDLK